MWFRVIDIILLCHTVYVASDDATLCPLNRPIVVGRRNNPHPVHLPHMDVIAAAKTADKSELSQKTENTLFHVVAGLVDAK